ncbi:MAG: DUF2950 domain-containing protein [Gammaproteobacteria bacterium]
MNDISENTQQTVVSRSHAIANYLFTALAAATILLSAACSEPDLASVELTVDPDLGQAVFAAPGDAANAFVLALANEDTELLAQVFGADYREVLPLDQVDAEDVDRFISAWEKFNTLLPEGDKTMLIAVGENEWTLPIPIVAGTSGWYFDIDEGLERMRIRRIGRNELATMQAVLAYYDAQMEYAGQDRDGDGLLEYAQRFISTPGTRDGLYWEVKDGEIPSPLGPLMAEHTPGGGYHGYFYRILDAQGEHAKGGAYSYLIGDQMRAGFAVIAWPVEYGDSGVVSFMVSHAGIVYQQDLGPDSASIAGAMTAYDPGPGWTQVEEVDGPDAAK